MSRDSMNQIVDVLANVFYEPGAARTLLSRIGYPMSRTPAFNSPTVFWSRVLGDIANGIFKGTERTLVEEAQRMFPTNNELNGLLGGAAAAGHEAPAAPQAVKGRGLPPEWIARLYQAGIDANIPDHRQALLARLPSEARAALPAPGGSSAAGILLTDINTLNQIAEQGDPDPLIRWLDTAALLSAVFRDAASTFEGAKSLLVSVRA